MPKISSWKMGNLDANLKLQICVMDDMGLTKFFYRFSAGWSDNGQRMEHVHQDIQEKLDYLVNAHEVLGCNPVLDFLGVQSTLVPEEYVE